MFFELEDVKRRHMPYFYLNNVTGWSDSMDSKPTWDYQRGIMTGLVAATFQEYLTHFINNTKIMLKHYEPPTSFTEAVTFVRETAKIESYTQCIKLRTQKLFYSTFFEVAPQVAMFRRMNHGWSSNFGGFETSFYRKIPTTFLAFLLTSPLGVVGEMAERAYVADKTFPKQLQKGYKSMFDALRRIPLEQGPYFLFKNTFPIYWKHIMGPFTAFYSFDWLRDKVSIGWRASNTPKWPIVWTVAAFSTWLGCILTYPFYYTTREMVDFWPKKNGFDPFQGNYRKAASWLYYGAPTWNVAFPGFFKKYFWNVFPKWFLTLIVAEHLGIFSYWRTDIMGGPGDNTNEDSDI